MLAGIAKGSSVEHSSVTTFKVKTVQCRLAVFRVFCDELLLSPHYIP